MNTLRSLLVATALGAVLLACSTASAVTIPILGNAGFENPVSAGDPPFSGRWQTFSLDGDETAGGDTAIAGTSMPRSGAQALELVIDANTPNSFAGVFQDAPATAGEMFSWSGYHKSVGNPGGIEIRIEWRDSVGDTEVGRTDNFTPMPGSEYELFDVTAEVPAGADTARVVYAIQSFGGVVDQLVYVDDINAIPEPTSMLLGGLGLMSLAVAARRRR